MTTETIEASETCHRCGVRPGTRRFYAPDPCHPYAHVAGQTLKFSMKETVGCDECWAAFQEEYEAFVREHCPEKRK
jgi:hypothetical protein